VQRRGQYEMWTHGQAVNDDWPVTTLVIWVRSGALPCKLQSTQIAFRQTRSAGGTPHYWRPPAVDSMACIRVQHHRRYTAEDGHWTDCLLYEGRRGTKPSGHGLLRQNIIIIIISVTVVLWRSKEAWQSGVDQQCSTLLQMRSVIAIRIWIRDLDYGHRDTNVKTSAVVVVTRDTSLTKCTATGLNHRTMKPFLVNVPSMGVVTIYRNRAVSVWNAFSSEAANTLTAFSRQLKQPTRLVGVMTRRRQLWRWHDLSNCDIAVDDDDDNGDEGRNDFSVALSPKTTRTRNNKPKQWSHVIVVSAMRRR